MLWMLKFAVTAIIAIAVFKLTANQNVHFVSTTDSQNYAVAAAYLDRSTHNAVLVGSSLTFRLSNYLQSADVENLALNGGASTTGMAIIATAPMPRLVVVEANILNRPMDDGFIARLNEATSFRPVRTAAARYEMLMHPPLRKEEIRSAVDRLIAQPPSEVVDSDLVRWVLNDSRTPPRNDHVQRGLSDIRRLKAQLETRGVKVLLFHMPSSPAYEQTMFAATSTRMASEAFPDANSWLPIDVDTSQLRWTDGVHLDDRSAAMVARTIENSIERLTAADAR